MSERKADLTMAVVTIERGDSRRLINKTDLLVLLPQGRKKSPVDVRIVVEKGTIALRTLGKQMPSPWKVLNDSAKTKLVQCFGVFVIITTFCGILSSVYL